MNRRLTAACVTVEGKRNLRPPSSPCWEQWDGMLGCRAQALEFTTRTRRPLMPFTSCVTTANGFTGPQFFPTGDNDGSHPIGLVRRLNDLRPIMCLEQCLAHSRHSTNVSCYYHPHHPLRTSLGLRI